MAYHITDTRIGHQGITDVSETQRHPFGTIVRATHPDRGEGEFVYVKGVTNGVVGAWVTYSMDDGTTALLAANARDPVGIMVSALDANTKFGWVQIEGKAIGRVLTGFTDNAAVYATATAGAVDDASVAGDHIFLAKGASAVLNSGETVLLAEFEIHRPFAPRRVTVAA